MSRWAVTPALYRALQCRSRAPIMLVRNRSAWGTGKRVTSPSRQRLIRELQRRS